MERSLRFSPLVLSSRTFAQRIEECWPDFRGTDQLFKIIQEVFSKIDYQEAFYFPASETLERGCYLTKFAIYVIESQLEQPVQGVAFLVIGIPFDPNVPIERRKIVESEIPLETVNKNLRILKGLSPNSKRNGKVDQVFSTFCLMQKEQGQCYIPSIVLKGHIAIYHPSEASLAHASFGACYRPVSVTIRRLKDVLSGIGSMHRADLIHGWIRGSSCPFSFNVDIRGEREVLLSQVHHAHVFGERRIDVRSLPFSHQAPWVWHGGVVGQVRGELVSEAPFDKSYDLFSFGRMVQQEIMRDLLIHFGDKYECPTRALVAQYFLPRELYPYKYSEADLQKFEEENPGRIFFKGLNAYGNFQLVIFEDPQVVFEKTSEVIFNLKAKAVEFSEKEELDALLELALLVRDLGEVNYFKFLYNFLGSEALAHDEREGNFSPHLDLHENNRDFLVRSIQLRLDGILGFERNGPALQLDNSILLDDPIEDSQIEEDEEIVPSSFLSEEVDRNPRIRFVFRSSNHNGNHHH